MIVYVYGISYTWRHTYRGIKPLTVAHLTSFYMSFMILKLIQKNIDKIYYMKY